jgi:hypothetical protein
MCFALFGKILRYSIPVMIKDTVVYNNQPVPIVLVIWKSACFLIHALLPRDLKARGLKSARSADFIKFWLY